MGAREGPHRPGERIYQGAEATLDAGMYLGRMVVHKRRHRKGYRIAPLEDTIARSRMRTEARLMRRARAAGVAVPAVLAVDPPAQEMVLEYLGRHALRTTFDALAPTRRRAMARAAGRAAGRLHRCGVVHGDLTTSNMIERRGTLYLIDFSLGRVASDTEDLAVDLKAFKDSFVATHLEHAGDFSHVLAGYAQAMGPRARHVIAHIGRIERRRRYA
jgi:Kae1-associated kinase Bud32